MTRAQMILSHYIEKNFIKGSVRIDLESDTSVKIRDNTGNVLRLTLNLYGDIMDADTKRIYAIGNVPHDIEHIKEQIPAEWI